MTENEAQPPRKGRPKAPRKTWHPREKHANSSRNTGNPFAPQNFEQVGEYHVLQSHVLLGTATEKEKKQFFVLEYENYAHTLLDLKEQEAAGTIRWPLRDDIPYYEKFLADNKEKYEVLRIEIMSVRKRLEYEREQRKLQQQQDGPVEPDVAQG